ncbi:MAG: lysostaphin resistance A-like protein [Candidatus Binatia bacterium]
MTPTHETAIALLLGLGCLVLLAVTGRLACVREEFPTAARRIAALVLLWGILSVAVFHPVVSPGAAAQVDPDGLPFAALFAGHVLLAGFLAAWWRLAYPEPLRRFLRLETASSADVGFGVRIGLLGWGVALMTGAAAALGLQAIGYAPGGGEEAMAVPPLLLWLADLSVERKLAVVAVAMTVEEAFFRGFLQPRIGWIPASVLFALAHAGYGLPTLLASVLALSLVIGWAFRRTGSLLPCIVAHGVFDAIQIFVVMPLAIEHLRRLA